MEKTQLRNDAKGGFLDNLVNGGKLPTVSVSLSNETLLYLGLTIVLSAVIVILFNALIKSLT